MNVTFQPTNSTTLKLLVGGEFRAWVHKTTRRAATGLHRPSGTRYDVNIAGREVQASTLTALRAKIAAL